MNISYTISVYNEILEIEKLLSFLFKEITIEDEIIVLHTYRNPEEQYEQWFLDIQNICKKYSHIYKNFHFQNNFSSMKNTLNNLATKNFIINLDADEMIYSQTLQLWKTIIQQNNNNDLFFVPRINTVDNYTIEDIKKYNWSINQHGWVNWPDYQPRIYKNNCGIEWRGDVHEQLVNHRSSAILPSEPNLSIIHHKTIEKQRQQNEFYKHI